jgi:hypothetical protein
MGLTPVPPNFSSNLQGYTPKSFWKRPEGPFGMVALAAVVGAAGVGFYLILPFVIALLANTLEAAGLAAALIAVLWLAFNPTFQTACSNLFKNSVRFFASWVVETDPIGILRNNLDDMKKAKYALDQTVQRFAGSDERLKRSIAAKSEEINGLGPQSRPRRANGRRRSGPHGKGATHAPAPDLPRAGRHVDAGRQAAPGP